MTFPISRVAATDLRTEVCEYAAALKAEGIAPEAAIIAIKRVLRLAGLRLTTHTQSTEAVLTEQDRLVEDVIVWCIEGYYADGDGVA